MCWEGRGTTWCSWSTISATNLVGAAIWLGQWFHGCSTKENSEILMESWNFSWNFFQVFIFTETFSIFCCCLGVDQRVFQGPFWVAWFLLHWGGSGRPKLLQKNPRLERQQGSDELFPWHHARRGTGKTARMRQLFRPLFWGTHGQYCFKFNVSFFFCLKR